MTKNQRLFCRTRVLVVVAALVGSACSGSRAASGSAPVVADGSTAADSGDAVVPTATTSAVDVRPIAVPATAHPRLWVTEGDVVRLRSWAVETNPVWVQGLGRVIEQVRDRVDSGKAADDGSAGWVEDPVEADAEVLAFASLIEPDEAQRAKDGLRARRLLLAGVGPAASGAANGAAYRDPQFAIGDRSRWWGEGWALTTDWIYPSLTKEDKTVVRAAFLRWAHDEERGGQTSNDHPQPVGAHDDPGLLQNPTLLSWSGNNYFTAHGRNIALMSLALDPEDDADGALRAQLHNAVGGFLAMTDEMLRTTGRGGAPEEGLEYGPQSIGYVAETLLALHTAGVDRANSDVARFLGNPFWDEIGPWLGSALSPTAVTQTDGSTRWLPATYGDAQTSHNPDWIQLFAPLAVYDSRIGGDRARLNVERWFELNTVGGGASDLPERVGNPSNPADAILYFLMFDPTLPAPSDPRPAWPKTNIAAGVGRLSWRTGWGIDARWLTMSAGQGRIDHQDGDGLAIELFRKGEWLTKSRSGYDVATSDQKNSLSIQNTRPEHNEPDDYRHIAWAHGSQFPYVNDGPGHIVATVASDAYAYASIDATSLYNSTREGSTDVTQATRSVLWLKPDATVVYDRATTRSADGFKRFNLQLATDATIAGRHASTTTPGWQQLSIDALLPAGASLSTSKVKINADGIVEDEGQLAAGETMVHRFVEDATGHPADVRFLNVLQGVDAGGTPKPTQLVVTTRGDRFEGAVVGDTLVLFPREADRNETIELDVPAGVVQIYIAGLDAHATYTVTTDHAHLHMARGNGPAADEGGVLRVERS
jgi:hypothetical protein